MAKTKRSKRKHEENKVYSSSGNVFADMGMEDPEKWQARASLVGVISDILDERGLNQTEAAEVLGLTQGRVSDLLRGKLHLFSLEHLMRLLNILNQEPVKLVIPRRKGKRRSKYANGKTDIPLFELFIDKEVKTAA